MHYPQSNPSEQFRAVEEWVYVASSLDFTYSPAVIISYLKGDSGVTQVGIGYVILFRWEIEASSWPTHLQNNIVIRPEE